MNAKQQARFQRTFFKKCGPNMETIAAMFESLPNVAFYIKDADGRIVAINQCNCELCNIPTPSYAIGKRSCDLFPKAYSDFCMARDRQVVETGVPIVNQRYSKVANLSKSLNILSIYPLRDAVGAIIGTLCTYRRGTPEKIGPIWQEKFDTILEKIEKDLAKPLSVERLSSESGMSIAHFQRMFMKIIGMRPGRYIIQQRLNAASRLLEKTDLGVSDIALSTGFCDQSHFTKMFKRERGITPGEYRRRHRSQAMS